MSADATPYWHWPGWGQLGYALRLGLAQTLLFAIVYGGANWLAEQHAYRLRMHTAVDLALPLVPAASLLYLSLNLLLWLPPFVLRTRRELRAFVAALALATIVAGICFVLAPAEIAYAPPTLEELGPWHGVYGFARALALENNFAPSLHVAFTTICGIVLARRASGWGCWLLVAWCLAIVAATLLTHEHYLIDVVTGGLLGWLAVKYGYDRLLAQLLSSADDTLPPSPSSDPVAPA